MMRAQVLHSRLFVIVYAIQKLHTTPVKRNKSTRVDSCSRKKDLQRANGGTLLWANGIVLDGHRIVALHHSRHTKATS